MLKNKELFFLANIYQDFLPTPISRFIFLAFNHKNKHNWKGGKRELYTKIELPESREVGSKAKIQGTNLREGIDLMCFCVNSGNFSSRQRGGEIRTWWTERGIQCPLIRVSRRTENLRALFFWGPDAGRSDSIRLGPDPNPIRWALI